MESGQRGLQSSSCQEDEHVFHQDLKTASRAQSRRPHAILIFLGRLSLERRVAVFTEIQGTPAHRNQGGPRGERHSPGQRSVHRGEHRPRMLLAHQLGGGEFVLAVPTSLLWKGGGVCVNPACL